jgi:hypothetical protein
MIAEHEWETLSLLIEEAWPGEFDDSAAKAWRVLLDDFDGRQVLLAIKLLVTRGGTFRPSVAEIVAEIRRDPGKPTWSEAAMLIFGKGGILKARTQRTKGSWDAGEREKADDEAAWERAAVLHPLAAAFVRLEGLSRLREVAVDLTDPQYGEATRKRLGESWERFCEANEHRDVAALVSGRRGEGLGKLDPLAALGRRAPELAEANGGHR